MVTVQVIQAFHHEGRPYRPGEGITVDPVIAAALAFRGVVSLLEYSHKEYPEPQIRTKVVEAAPSVQAALDAPKTRRRRSPGTYRRRDMRAEDQK